MGGLRGNFLSYRCIQPSFVHQQLYINLSSKGWSVFLKRPDLQWIKSSWVTDWCSATRGQIFRCPTGNSSGTPFSSALWIRIFDGKRSDCWKPASHASFDTVTSVRGQWMFFLIDVSHNHLHPKESQSYPPKLFSLSDYYFGSKILLQKVKQELLRIMAEL